MNEAIGHILSTDQENAKRNYNERTQLNNINQQKTSNINSMAGMSLTSIGGGLSTVRGGIKRIKQLKSKFNVRKGVNRLLGKNEETTAEPEADNDFFSFGGLDETDPPRMGTSRILPESASETKQSSGTASDFFSNSTQETPQFSDEIDANVNRLMGKYPQLDLDREMKIAQFKADNRGSMVEMDEGQQQRFISEGVDDKPNDYPSSFGASSQPNRGPGGDIEMSNVTPEHAYARSNEEILRTGYEDPRSYNSGGRDISQQAEGAQNAPEANPEMLDVIGSGGQKVGVSQAGADLTQEGETLTSQIGSKIQSGIDTVANVGSDIATGTEATLSAGLEAADIGINALDFLPVIGEITGAVSLIGGIGLAIGSSIIGGEKAQENQASTENTYNQQLNTASNYAGRYVSKNFSSQSMFQ
jgi:hypothetical protein